jgi:hypothetical protein
MEVFKMIRSKRQTWALGFAIVIFGFWLWSRIDTPTPVSVGDMEANHPWMVFDPAEGQGLPIPYADRRDPNILYLIFVMRNGFAMKINLNEKMVTPCQFSSDDGDPVTTIRYSSVHDRTMEAWLQYSIPGMETQIEKVPIWDEFRGQTETRKVSHLFGYPIANKPGKRIATLQTGYWYVMDGREGNRVELLRIKVKNSELTGDDSIGNFYVSPNKKWAVFQVANHNPYRIFIFDREAKSPEVFE